MNNSQLRQIPSLESAINHKLRVYARKALIFPPSQTLTSMDSVLFHFKMLGINTRVENIIVSFSVKRHLLNVYGRSFLRLHFARDVFQLGCRKVLRSLSFVVDLEEEEEILRAQSLYYGHTYTNQA